MRKRVVRMTLFAGLVAMALLAASCGGGGGNGGEEAAPATTEAAPTAAGGETGQAAGTAAEPSGEPIVIGDTGSESGILASLDQPASTGVQMAIDDVNANGGVLGRPLEYVHVDGKSDPNEGAKAALDVLDQGAELVVITCDFDFGAPAALEAEKAGKISFSQCGASTKFGPIGIGPHAFTMATSAPTQGNIGAEFAYNEKGWKTAWTLLDNSIDFEKQGCGGFTAKFEQLGGKIVGTDTMLQSDPQIGSQITRLKSLNPQPDFLMVCTYQPGLAQVIRQIRAAGINLPIYGFEDTDGTFWHETVPNISNVFFGTYGNIQGKDPDPKVNDFFKRFAEQEGGPPPTSHAETGYSIVEAWANAAEEAGTIDADAVQQVLESWKDVPLLVGPTSFSPDYHVQTERSMRIMEITAPNTIDFVTEYKPTDVILPPQ
jgi:branched-chain amino acid transport system substrate-binding protein